MHPPPCPPTSLSGLLQASLPERKLRRVMFVGLMTTPTSAALGAAVSLSISFLQLLRLPRGFTGKEPTCQCRRCGFNHRSGRSLEKEMATHSSILAWRIPRSEEPGGVQSRRVRHDSMRAHRISFLHSLFYVMLSRRYRRLVASVPYWRA